MRIEMCMDMRRTAQKSEDEKKGLVIRIWYARINCVNQLTAHYRLLGSAGATAPFRKALAQGGRKKRRQADTHALGMPSAMGDESLHAAQTTTPRILKNHGTALGLNREDSSWTRHRRCFF